MYLAHGSVDSAIQAAQIAAVASVIGAIVSIIIAVYNNRMRLKAEEKMYVAKMYIEKSEELYKSPNDLSNKLIEIQKIVIGMHKHTYPKEKLSNNEIYKSLQDGDVPEIAEIAEIGSYYPELIPSIKELDKSFSDYCIKLDDVAHTPEESIKEFMENEMANSRLALATVGIELQKLVLKKVKIMNDDNKPIFDRFIEWLRK